jgi:hypothetical protein
MIILDVIASLTIGPLLMYWWMNRQLERSVTTAKRCAEARLTEQQQRSALSLNGEALTNGNSLAKVVPDVVVVTGQQVK